MDSCSFLKVSLTSHDVEDITDISYKLGMGKNYAFGVHPLLPGVKSSRGEWILPGFAFARIWRPESPSPLIVLRNYESQSINPVFSYEAIQNDLPAKPKFLYDTFILTPSKDSAKFKKLWPHGILHLIKTIDTVEGYLSKTYNYSPCLLPWIISHL